MKAVYLQEVLRVRKKTTTISGKLNSCTPQKCDHNELIFASLDVMQSRITILGPQISMYFELPESSYNFTLKSSNWIESTTRLQSSAFQVCTIKRDTYDGKSKAERRS